MMILSGFPLRKLQYYYCIKISALRFSEERSFCGEYCIVASKMIKNIYERPQRPIVNQVRPMVFMHNHIVLKNGSTCTANTFCTKLVLYN